MGVVLAFVLRAASNLMLNDFCQNALGSFALAVAAYLLRRGAFLGMSLDVVIISAIMPLVPGVTFTAAIRDTLNGDYSSGVARMAEAVVVALAVASGVDRGSPAGGRIGMTEMIRELMIQSVGAFLAIFGFSLLVDMPRKYLVYAGITGGAGWLAYLVSMQVGTSQVAAAFFSSLAAALLSQVFARVLKAPVTIFLVAGILPTVPGASIYRSVYFLIQGQTKWYNFYLIQTIQIAGAMAVAIFIVDSLFRLLRNKAS